MLFWIYCLWNLCINNIYSISFILCGKFANLQNRVEIGPPLTSYGRFLSSFGAIWHAYKEQDWSNTLEYPVRKFMFGIHKWPPDN